MSAVGLATGAVVGLVAITPASGFVDAPASIVIGIGAGLLGYFAVILRPKTGLDDSLDVFSVHGVGGIWGAIATGLFAVEAIGGKTGLIAGNAGQVGIQIVGILATLLYSGIVTVVIIKLLDVIPGLGIRAEQAHEAQGLDLAAHGERAYVQDGAD
jgi:Amt family ammonium transporter